MVTRLRLVPLLLAAACASAPPPAPKTDTGGVIAISVEVRRADTSGTGYARVVHFVRLGERGDPLRGRKIVTSGFERGGVCYLLDAPPGRYAAVGCGEDRDGRKLTTTFSAGLVRDTVVELAPGGFASLGRVAVDVIRIGGEPDAAQRHYRPLLEPDWGNTNVVNQIFGKSRYWIGREYRLRRDDPAVARRARELLAPNGWADRFGGGSGP